MRVWLHAGPNLLRALTNDREGANLPENLGRWMMVRTVALQGDASDEQEAIALIGEHGYCCLE